MSLATHPLLFVNRLRSAYGEELTLSFSRYYYRPQSLLDEREYFEVPAADVTPDWFREQEVSLPKDWELAFNSLIKDKRGRTRHVGLIDFIGRPSTDQVHEGIRNILGPKMARRMILFDSGRSLHAYILELLTPVEWHRFLGRLLLLNKPGQESMIDTRWVGHRLLGGYAALRWTSNSDFYEKRPDLVM